LPIRCSVQNLAVRIWFPKPYDDGVIEALRALVPAHTVSRDPSSDAEMLIEGRPDEAMLDEGSGLKWVVVPFAGVPHATIDLIRSRPDITLHNLHHNAPHTAETALALLFAAAKQIVPMDQAMRRNDWGPRYTPEWTELLGGKTAVILGYGEIGRRVGAVLRALEMTVLGVRRHPSGPDEFGPADFPSLLPRAEVLIISAPLNAETEGLVGPAEIAALPDGAILVNVGRAQVVDERALYEALKSGKLHSAGLDVWYRYPVEKGTAVPGYFTTPPPSALDTPPSAYPFGELRNVVMSPHRGGATAGTEAHRVKHLARLIEIAASGNQVPNRVDFEAGY